MNRKHRNEVWFAALVVAFGLLGCSGDGAKENPLSTGGESSVGDNPSAADNTGSRSGLKGQIAFQSNRDFQFGIYLMNADGSGTRRISHQDNRLSGSPFWKPDGSRITYYAVFGDMRAGGVQGLFTNTADGSDQQLVPGSTGGDVHGSWSPDGSQIVVMGHEEEEEGSSNSNLYVMNADGSNRKRLTDTIGDDWDPSWSPDGSRIAFASERDGDMEIYVMNADGSGLKQLTHNGDDASSFPPVGESDMDPSWSPDGSRIVFYSNYDEGMDEIFVMDADGGNRTQLTHRDRSFSSYHPSWSPDGSKIVFIGNDLSVSVVVKGEVYVMEADGSDPVRLTNDDYNDAFPVWRPE